MSAKRCEGGQCVQRDQAAQCLELLENCALSGALKPGVIERARDRLPRWPSATVRFFWPGVAPTDACAMCAERARAIANALGFDLVTQDITTGEELATPSRFSLIEIE